MDGGSTRLNTAIISKVSTLMRSWRGNLKCKAFMLKSNKIQVALSHNNCKTIINSFNWLLVTQWKEIEELMQQIYSAACKVEASYELPDLSTALRQIQSQYDSIAAKNLEVRCHFLVINIIHSAFVTKTCQVSHLKIAVIHFFRTWIRGTDQSFRTWATPPPNMLKACGV